MNNLIVRAGQELSATLWNAFWRERRGTRLKPGPGVLLTETGDGTIVSFRASARPFIPSFKVTLTGTSASFGLGLVNGWEPRLDGRPISGILPYGEKDPKGVPKLKLSDTSEFFDITGRSWLALRAQVDAETGRLLQPDEQDVGELGLSIIQRDSCPPTDPDDDTIGYHRIAMLRRGSRDTTGLGTLYQISMFDYQHRTARQNGKWRHFFDPA